MILRRGPGILPESLQRSSRGVPADWGRQDEATRDSHSTGRVVFVWQRTQSAGIPTPFRTPADSSSLSAARFKSHKTTMCECGSCGCGCKAIDGAFSPSAAQQLCGNIQFTGQLMVKKPKPRCTCLTVCVPQQAYVQTVVYPPPQVTTQTVPMGMCCCQVCTYGGCC